jgi:hypothetical protein
MKAVSQGLKTSGKRPLHIVTSKKPFSPAAGSSRSLRTALIGAQVPVQTLSTNIAISENLSPELAPNKKKETLSIMSLQRKIFALQENADLNKKMAEFDKNADDSVFLIQDREELSEGTPTTGTAFVIEEIYEGKRFLWGVTAAHMLNYVGPNLFAYISDIPFPWKTSVVFAGESKWADVAIFPIPEEYYPYLKPIPIADKGVEIGEKVRSFGYFDGGFHIVRDRIVQEITNGRFSTSFQFKENQNRRGACGGPILNVHNELVGIHCGSSAGTPKVSFAVPAQKLKELIIAYRHNKIFLEKLKFKGKEIGEININQHLLCIEAYTKGRLLAKIYPENSAKQPIKTNYAHLENLFLSLGFDLSEGADRIEITIIGEYNPQKPTETKPFSYVIIYLPLEDKVYIREKRDL